MAVSQSVHAKLRGVDVKEHHEEEQNRYTFGFILFVLILLASLFAASLKAILTVLGI